MTDQGRQDPRRSVVEWLNSGHIQAEIKRALPDHVPVDFFMRVAQTALLNQPDLAKAEKASLLRELVAVAQLGLVLDPQLGEAWLIIDRNGKVQRRVGYQGLRRLALQSGEVTSLNAQAVYKHDVCAISLGDSPSVKHEIAIAAPDRGPIIGYYAVARIKGQTDPMVEWMSQAQVDAHRDRYSDAYKHKSGPWADPLAAIEMGRKTSFRRLAKWLPKSPLLAEALADEDRADMRDVTPGAQDMLPAPSDDPMDQVVAEAAQRSRQEPAAEPGTETAAEAAASYGDPQERAVPRYQPSSAPAQAAEPAKRKQGRPSKAEVVARLQETLARQIIAEIDAAAPADVDGVLQTREEDIADLPDELRTEIVAAAQDRMGAVSDDEPWADPEPDADPLDAEGKPPVGGIEPDPFDLWVAELNTYAGGTPPDLVEARKRLWLTRAEKAGWGERGAQAVEKAFAR